MIIDEYLVEEKDTIARNIFEIYTVTLLLVSYEQKKKEVPLT